MSSAIGVRSPNADAYVWAGTLTYGYWASANNWKDATTGKTPAPYSPGPLTPVKIAGLTQETQGQIFKTILGGGSAASLELTGNVKLDGDFTVTGALDVTSGVLAVSTGSTVTSTHSAVAAGSINVRADTTVSSNSTLSTSGALSVSSGKLTVVGGAVSAGGTANTAGLILVGGGGKLTIGGTLTATGGGFHKLRDNPVHWWLPYPPPPSGVTASVVAGSSSSVRLGGVVFSATASGTASPSLGLDVEDNSTIEIGTAGNAAAGAITVDAGRSIVANVSASLSGKLVNNGTVTIIGGTLTQNGSLSGSGAVRIGKNATLALNGNAAATDTITFLDTGAALSIGAGFKVDAILTGFRAGDSLLLNTPVTAATYAAGAGGKPGTLTLSNGTTTVATLRLAGDFTGKSFVVSPTGGNGSAVSLVGQTQTDPLFDSKYYLAHSPDVAAAGTAPYQHYLTYGWKEGRNPSALFDTSYYLQQNPDVRAAKVNPLLHFEQHGWKEGRDPSLMFSDAKYLAANPDVKAAGVDPLLHYVSNGQSEGRMAFLPGGTAAADPLVDPALYDKQLGATLIPTGVAAQQQAAASYDATGWQEGLNPDALFDTKYYLSHNPDIAAAHINPLLHYEQYGWKEDRDPSSQFSTSKYLGANPDVKAAAINPLLHYVQYGQAEGRTAFNV